MDRQPSALPHIVGTSQGDVKPEKELLHSPEPPYSPLLESRYVLHNSDLPVEFLAKK
jgi:hypothetical protein